MYQQVQELLGQGVLLAMSDEELGSFHRSSYVGSQYLILSAWGIMSHLFLFERLIFDWAYKYSQTSVATWHLLVGIGQICYYFLANVK